MQDQGVGNKKDLTVDIAVLVGGGGTISWLLSRLAQHQPAEPHYLWLVALGARKGEDRWINTSCGCIRPDVTRYMYLLEGHARDIL